MVVIFFPSMTLACFIHLSLWERVTNFPSDLMSPNFEKSRKLSRNAFGRDLTELGAVGVEELSFKLAGEELAALSLELAELFVLLLAVSFASCDLDSLICWLEVSFVTVGPFEMSKEDVCSTTWSRGSVLAIL